MTRTQTLQQALAEQGITLEPRREPPAPPLGEPPPTGNEPEDEEVFDPTGILSPRGTPMTPIEHIPPREHLKPGTQRQLAAFEAMRAELGFCPEAPRPPALDSDLVAALAQRWSDEIDLYEFLRNVGEHDPAVYGTIDFLRLMFPFGSRVVLRDGDVGSLWAHHVREGNLGPMVHSNDGQFQVNPVNPGTGAFGGALYPHVLLRFSSLPEETVLRILPQIPVWIRAIYRRPGLPVEALLEIGAGTAGEFSTYMAYLKPYLAAVGADPDYLKSAAFSRLPVAEQSDTIEDILYMDTRPIPVDARPILVD